MHSLSPFLVAICAFILTVAATNTSDARPAVVLDSGAFIGATDGVTTRFLGIPYAQPPYVFYLLPRNSSSSFPCSVGDLRFRRPVPIDSYTGTHAAAEFGPSCPQQFVTPTASLPPGIDLGVTLRILNTIFNLSVPQSEDCV